MSAFRPAFQPAFQPAFRPAFGFGSDLRAQVIEALFGAGEQGILIDPSDTSTLFQDSAGTTPVTADSQPVGKVLDLSGNGNHLTQATAAARPLYRTDGTLHWLQFDGVDDALSTASNIDLSGTDKVDAFFALQKEDTDDFHCGMEFGVDASSVSGSFGIWAPWNNVGGYGVLTRGATSLNIYQPVTFSAPTKNVVTGLLDHAGADLAAKINARVDGVRYTSNGSGGADSGNYASSRLYVGARTASSFFLKGRIYGLAFSGAQHGLTTAELTEEFFAGKAGVTLQ